MSPRVDAGADANRSGARADDALLEIRGLTVRRGGDALLAAIDLTVGRGTLHVLLGPNGAGKSTLLAAILGQIDFAGSIVARWRRDGRIGLVPQAFAVDRTLPVTVADFLALSRQRRPVCLGVGAAARRRVAALLDRVGMAAAARKPLSVLSGGELRRVLLANALDPLPELLLLDEPASGLDEAAAARLEELLLAACRQDGVTVLMVSHDRAQARRIGDRVTVLARTVRADGPAAAVLGAAASAGEVQAAAPAGSFD